MISQKMTVREFKKMAWSHYRRYGRDFPWRHTSDPYKILVSEIMLQQTQTSRVAQKYKSFLAAFPDFTALHKASLRKVLTKWQGLGYNRRALALKSIASKVVREYGGLLPEEQDVLATFPGIGMPTAGAIRAFAFNKPAVFIETNIRRVFIDSFFPRRKKITDKELLPYIEKTLDKKNSRKWYWALMDYGVALGKEKKQRNPNKRSAHYRTQSAFAGSRRETRGNIIKLLLRKHRPVSIMHLAKTFSLDSNEILEIITAMRREGIIAYHERKISIV